MKLKGKTKSMITLLHRRDVLLPSPHVVTSCWFRPINIITPIFRKQLYTSTYYIYTWSLLFNSLWSLWRLRSNLHFFWFNWIFFIFINFSCFLWNKYTDTSLSVCLPNSTSIFIEYHISRDHNLLSFQIVESITPFNKFHNPRKDIYYLFPQAWVSLDLDVRTT